MVGGARGEVVAKEIEVTSAKGDDVSKRVTIGLNSAMRDCWVTAWPAVAQTWQRCDPELAPAESAQK
jgi:hypothetical protein